MRTLIMEDDPASALVLTMYIQSMGEVFTAGDGISGFNEFKRAFEAGEPYELVCLDIMMPGMDGQDVLKEIRAFEAANGVVHGKETRVIMTTALNDKRNLVEAIPRCDAYLTKPIDRTRLLFYVKKFGLLSVEEAKEVAERAEKRRNDPGAFGSEKDMPWVD